MAITKQMFLDIVSEMLSSRTQPVQGPTDSNIDSIESLDLDSIDLADLTERIESILDCSIDPDLFYSDLTIDEIIQTINDLSANP